MGNTDIQTGDYLEDKERFADLTNVALFQGRRVVLPEELQEADTEVVLLQEEQSRKLVRDKVRLWNGVVLAILVVENQTYVDYRMVFRNMLSESMAYQKQWRENADKHENVGDLRSGSEFLSKMKKTDKFPPILTLVVYYGTEGAWDGPRTLYELLELNELEKELQPLVNDYHMNLYDFHTRRDYELFQTEWRYVFEVLSRAADMEALGCLLEQKREEYSRMDRKTGRLISSLTNISNLDQYRNTDEEGGTVNMCKAFEDMKLAGIREGMEQGLTQGLERGKEQGAKALIEICREFGLSREETRCKVESKFILPAAVTEDYLKKYWE